MVDLIDAELVRRLRTGEDGLTEFKSNLPRNSDLRRTLVAFANSTPEGQTGLLLIGVSNEGKVLGASNTDANQKKIRMVCEHDCYPPIRVSCRTFEQDGKLVLAIMVPHSTKRPHFAGPAYVRDGSATIVASEQQYEDLISSHHDVCRKILSWGQVVITVEMLGKRLGDGRPLERAYRASCEAQVTECNPHYVRLFDIGTATNHTEPLENVVPSYDENRYRPKLTVRLPGQR